MRRVTRGHRWGKLSNNQETRWVGSRQLTWEHMAHRKLRQKPCAKQDTNTQLMRILISLVHTSHDSTKAHRQWNTQAACHTAQDITWMHAADKNTNCMHTTSHVDKRACGRANSRLHAHKTRQNMEHECPNPDTKPKLKTWVPGSEHHSQHKTRHERAHGFM